MSTWRPIPPPRFWQRWLPECLHGPVRWLFRLSMVGLLIISGLAFCYLLLAMRFDLNEVARLPADPVYYDRRGRELPAPSGAGRRLVTRQDLPDFLVQALQAREDARFYQHCGIDFRGLGRATLRNLKDREFTQGASTLSMQLARNTFDIHAKSLHRKFLEIALTLRIEARYSKDEILTDYLNRIYFGAGAHGIEQAAQTYFGKPTGALKEGECALLVGIIRGPRLFSPLRNLDAAIEQRDQTLSRMLAMGFINEARRSAISAQAITLATDEQRENQPSYALRAMQRELNLILDEQDIRLGGLHVNTTLDAAWQDRLDTELTRAVTALEQEKSWGHPTHAAHPAGTEPRYVQYAAVTTETRTGAILALIGGRDYQHSRFDRTRSSRDLGSAFEPFVAAAAAERGKLVLPGKPVQTGRQIGPAEVECIAKRCGLAGPFLLMTDDLFRGSVAATPMEMSIGLATLGNQGKRPRPFLIRDLRDASGKTLYTATPNLRPALSPNAAQDATSVLRRHAGTRCFTGATGSERDAWTLRLGPGGATAIWIGFDQPTVIARAPRLQSLLDEFVARLGNE
ncbi:MAG: transglycosylase domain-containing protein [Verrucomicrobia bacterium]|nr:transglycosylase domain-containing protein [Verrucomicrobiota bacterium]